MSCGKCEMLGVRGPCDECYYRGGQPAPSPPAAPELPDGCPEGEAVTDDDDDGGCWLRDRCYACGHTLRFSASGCPQCGETFDGRDDPKRWPKKCTCARCTGEKP